MYMYSEMPMHTSSWGGLKDGQTVGLAPRDELTPGIVTHTDVHQHTDLDYREDTHLNRT
jgi:hypothetical protein